LSLPAEKDVTIALKKMTRGNAEPERLFSYSGDSRTARSRPGTAER
jgi:hypothetical protein